jgi:hypothetical protein
MDQLRIDPVALIPPPRRPAEGPVYAARDAAGVAVLRVDRNGLPYDIYSARDFSREEWLRLVQQVAGTHVQRPARVSAVRIEEDDHG